MKSSGLSVFLSTVLVSLPRVADCLTVDATLTVNATMGGNGTSSDQICNALEAAGLSILRPNSTAYQTRDTSYFSVSEHLSPYCIVQPKDTAEVVSTVNILRESTINWAVRGGGHMTWAGSANIDDGVTLDLGLINQVTYAEDSKVASIGAGARWADVYTALEQYGVTAPGGRTATVGVGGYLLAGGNNFYSGNVGLACDNVVNYEVVLASSEIINANNNTNSNLFKALKGGSCNFGIVTRYDMETVDGYTLWGGQVTWPLNTTEQHIAAYVKWVDNIRDYPQGSAVTFWAYTPSTGIIVSSAIHDTSAAVLAPAYDVFFNITPQTSSTLRTDSHLNMTIELEEPSGYRQIWMTVTGLNDERFIRRAVQAQSDFIAQWKAEYDATNPDFYNYITFQAMPTLLFEHSTAKGGNILGMEGLGKNAVLFQMQHMVRTADEEAVARERLMAMRDTLKAYDREQGIDVEWEYLGYADGQQDPLGSYGAENIQYIRDVAAEYDPDQVFQTRVPGGFKISKVSQTSD